jgi:hypothetical protein
MRSYYGHLFGAETSFTFRPDGTVRVWSGNNFVELTAKEMIPWYEAIIP